MFNSIKNLILNIREDYRKDSVYRRMAEKQFENIVGNIYEQNLHPTAYKYNGKNYYGVVYDNYIRIYFLFQKHEIAADVGGFYNKTNKAIVIFINVETEEYLKLFKENTSETSENIAKMMIDKYDYDVRNTFIHEYIHYLDSNRIDWTKALKGYKSANTLGKEGKNTEKYYTHPVEYNAYIQTAFSSYVKYMSRYSILHKLENLKDFNSFFIDLGLYLPDQLKYKSTKVKKRAYNFYVNYKKEVEENKRDLPYYVNKEMNKFSELPKGLLRNYLLLDKEDWIPWDTANELESYDRNRFPEMYWYANSDSSIRKENREYFNTVYYILRDRLTDLRNELKNEKNN